MAICLLEIGSDDDGEKDSNDVEAKKKRRLESKEEAAKLMVRVPGLRQKIAGKSIPLEVQSQSHLLSKSHLTLWTQKFVARKARKFQSQNQHLALPALELAYIFRGIAHAPRTVIVNKILPQTDIVLTRINQSKDDINGYIGGRGSYWDDFCLGMFLKGVCMRYVAYPVSFFHYFAMVLMIRYSFRTRMQNWTRRK
jgi:Protein of unknown function (DUF3808)